MKDKYEIARAIKNAGEWNPDDCRDLCELAGLETEWEEADSETFEEVLYKAAAILGVDIF